jgi:hypothetical protein
MLGGAIALAKRRRPIKQKSTARLDERIVALLDRIAGEGQTDSIVARLLDEPPERVADDIARSAAFGRLYKLVRTSNVGVDGATDANPGLVGLPALPPGLTFDELFRQHFRPRLGKRAEGFDVLFKSALSHGRSILVVETGCLRVPGNWEGDGQSTFMFDALVRMYGGVLFSIDVSSESVDSARRVCSSATQLIENDSVSALHALAQIVSKQIDLLYMDSFDLDPENPLPSAIHHALELTAVRPLIGPGTVVCVDDYAVGETGGKGMIVDRFLSNIRAQVLYSGYQKVWRLV